MRFWRAWGAIVFLLALKLIMPTVFMGLEHTLEELFRTADTTLKVSRESLNASAWSVVEHVPPRSRIDQKNRLPLGRRLFFSFLLILPLQQ